MLDPQGLGDFRYSVVNLGLRHWPDRGFQREFKVLADGITRVKRVLLQHQGHVPLCRTPAGHVLAANQNAALAGFFQPGNQAQGRGLASACLPQKHKEFAIGDVEIDALQGGDAAKFLDHAFKLYLCHQSLIPKETPVSRLNRCSRDGSNWIQTFVPTRGT